VEEYILMIQFVCINKMLGDRTDCFL